MKKNKKEVSKVEEPILHVDLDLTIQELTILQMMGPILINTDEKFAPIGEKISMAVSATTNTFVEELLKDMKEAMHRS